MKEDSDKKTILIVDDLRANVLVLQKILEPEWLTQAALTGGDALLAVDEAAPPDLILLDVQLPDMTGHEVCRRLKENPATRNIPIIFITATEDGDNEAQGLEMGAADYIIKPVHAPIVRARIRNHIALKEALTELAQKNEELERLASYDRLTGLYNRRKLDEHLDREVLRAERYHRPLSVILVDLDQFKAVNDTFGHLVGDSVLAHAASHFTQILRKSDIAGRWGGDEFLLICPETSAEDATHLADRIRKAYAEKSFAVAGKLSASFGVASFQPGRQASDMIHHVDKALYHAKNNGRNQVKRENTAL